MDTNFMLRELSVVTLKKEITSNVTILSKLQPMSTELSQLILKENPLEKPTQTLFNHLSYYLISIIDKNVSDALTWPLFDTKGERAYRNEIASFITTYSSKGLLTPVMSSYLVNPGCFKVIVLMFQLSQLAVNQKLVSVMSKDSDKKLYTEMTQMYQAQPNEGFNERINRETWLIHRKISKHLHKRKAIEEIAALFRKNISSMETKLATCNAQDYLNNFVDGFLRSNDVDEETRQELMNFKDINKDSKIFDAWLSYVDTTMDNMVTTWDNKFSSLLQSCKTLQQSTETLIARHTGQCDKSTYTLEYNPKTDEICTKELQSLVNSEQKYVLQNLHKDGQQNFPNLVRAFAISINVILRNLAIGDEIYRFNEYLESGRGKYSELVLTMRDLMDRVSKIEDKLETYQPIEPPDECSIWIKDLPHVPPMPDLSNLKARRDTQMLFDSFTPWNIKRHQFNLNRKNTYNLFAKPLPKLRNTPFRVPKENFNKSVISCRVSNYDRQTDIHSMSTMSHVNPNETISECTSGFTKQQVLALLTTKKPKIFKYSRNKPSNIPKGLFNETKTSQNDSLMRSYSTPNLCESGENRLYIARGRTLSITEEDSPMSRLEMSGIRSLDKEICTPPSYGYAESSRNGIDTSSLPTITITKDAENVLTNILNNPLDLPKEMDIHNVSPILDKQSNDLEMKDATPKSNSSLIKKSGSLEKIINRYKKLRANIHSEKTEVYEDIKTISEEKEDIKIKPNLFTANRNILPDLLSPSFNGKSD